MKWDKVSVGIALAAGLCVVAYASRTKAAPAPGEQRLLTIGDSLMVGMAPHFRRLATSAGFASVGNESEGGTRATKWAPKMEALIAKYKPTLILVSLGTNDAAGNPSSSQSSIAKIVSVAKAAGVPLVWILPPTLPAKTSVGTPFQDNLVRQMVLDTGVRTFDSRNVQFARTSDGIHAPPQGYETWAKAVWASL